MQNELILAELVTANVSAKTTSAALLASVQVCSLL